MPRALFLAALFLATTFRATASTDPVTADAGAPFAVVELFTSEGCSSCPPADRLLSDLVAAARRDGRRVYPLSFHVDYWDRLGWRDPWGDPEHARRQSRYAGPLQPRYTPQMVVNGGESFVGSDRARAERSIAAALARRAAGTLRVRVAAAENGHVRVRWEATAAPQDAELHAALIERGLESRVGRGENAGRTLTHDNVVRVFRTLPWSKSGTIDFSLPADLRPGRAAVVIFAQEKRHHTILAAAAAEVPLPAP
jgi:hypothetical protein